MGGQPKKQIFTFFASVLVMAACGERPGSRLQSLPNDGFLQSMESDFFLRIQETFEPHELDLETHAEALDPLWPLAAQPDLMTRFGTPTHIAGFLNYDHEALDIRRADPTAPQTVRTPVKGQAALVHDGGSDDPYSTAVVIYDEQSHYLLSLLHVDPAPRFETDGLTPVEKGAPIGDLAPVTSMESPDEAKYRHVHLSVIDLKQKRLEDPEPYLAEGYLDTASPVAERVYFLDSNAELSAPAPGVELDVVAEVFDRDGLSGWNFEVAALSYDIKDDKGRVLASSAVCDLTEFTAKGQFQEERPLPSYRMLDLAATDGQTQEGFFSFPTDALNPERTFRYALTHLKANRSGPCQLLSDEAGTLVISPATDKITVEISLRDHQGNWSRKSFVFPVEEDPARVSRREAAAPARRPQDFKVW